MRYFELVVAVKLQDELPFLASYNFIANLISRAMLDEQKLKELHKANTFKFYTFCAFHPLEPEKVYHKGRVYITNIRSLSADFILALKRLLPRADYPVKIISTEVRNYEYRPISELRTLTPAVMTVSDKCWVKEDGVVMLMGSAHINAFKKYRAYFGDMPEPQENFIEYIRQTNHKASKIPYKNTSLLGNKFEIGVKPDEISQKLAFTVLGAGVLEKSSLGMGYCYAK
ncbi:MAG: CRISPR-associated endoribonuclease Cas6 [Clostridia bacterium]|nr:CRISPR-associated endoribonuclease Cas6 [Clostridia bacterium]